MLNWPYKSVLLQWHQNKNKNSLRLQRFNSTLNLRLSKQSNYMGCKKALVGKYDCQKLPFVLKMWDEVWSRTFSLWKMFCPWSVGHQIGQWSWLGDRRFPTRVHSRNSTVTLNARLKSKNNRGLYKLVAEIECGIIDFPWNICWQPMYWLRCSEWDWKIWQV